MKPLGAKVGIGQGSFKRRRSYSLGSRRMTGKTELSLEVLSCFRSSKSGGGLILDINIGNPMTNPPKSSMLRRDLFDVRFLDRRDGRVYRCESRRFFRVGEIQRARRASLRERVSVSQKLKDESSGKTLRIVFL